MIGSKSHAEPQPEEKSIPRQAAKAVVDGLAHVQFAPALRDFILFRFKSTNYECLTPLGSKLSTKKASTLRRSQWQ